MDLSSSPFAGLQRGAYRTIMADPPWSFTTYSAKGHAKTPHAHYACMTLAEIQRMPVASLAHPEGCALVMWATAPMMPEAMETMAAWGFAYKTMAPWAKRSKGDAAWAFGTGYWFRNAAEFYLLGTRGSASPQARNVRGLTVAPVREHSRKPDATRRDIERLCAGPRCELFGRQLVDGWDVWGNQTDLFPSARQIPQEGPAPALQAAE